MCSQQVSFFLTAERNETNTQKETTGKHPKLPVKKSLRAEMVSAICVLDCDTDSWAVARSSAGTLLNVVSLRCMSQCKFRELSLLTQTCVSIHMGSENAVEVAGGGKITFSILTVPLYAVYVWPLFLFLVFFRSCHTQYALLQSTRLKDWMLIYDLRLSYDSKGNKSCQKSKSCLYSVPVIHIFVFSYQVNNDHDYYLLT